MKDQVANQYHESNPLLLSNLEMQNQNEISSTYAKGRYSLLSLAVGFTIFLSGAMWWTMLVDKPLLQPKSAELFPGQSDLIISLPGLEAIEKKEKKTFEKQYSGYLTLPKGESLHYWFIESQKSPEKDPVVLWLNGGPGASSLAGLFQENGPFTMNDDLSLTRNPHSWNQEANMLYFESPIGVGYSYNISGIYESNDFLQAKDNYFSLIEFFKKFPHLSKNELFLTGESYGGVYIPSLAKEILLGNDMIEKSNYGESAVKINLIGCAVGNGVNEFSVNSQMYFAYYHGLIGTELWHKLEDACGKELAPAHIPNFNFFDLANEKNQKQLNGCGRARMEAFASMMADHINTYDIYRKCTHGDPMFGVDKLISRLQEESEGINIPAVAQPLGVPITLCMDATTVEDYLNRADVKQAIHVPSEITFSAIIMTNTTAAGLKALNLSTKNVLNYGMPLNGHVISLWRELLGRGLRYVLYHGDTDFMCDFMGGQWAVDSMGLNVSSPRKPWRVGDQTAGYVIEYQNNNLTFLTVKGAGHMVPQWKPEEAAHMLARYILRSTDADS